MGRLCQAPKAEYEVLLQFPVASFMTLDGAQDGHVDLGGGVEVVHDWKVLSFVANRAQGLYKAVSKPPLGLTDVETDSPAHPSNVICCIRCFRCGLLSIGETKRRLGDRFVERLCSVRDKRQPLPVANHFNSPSHSLDDMYILGRLQCHNNAIRKLEEQHLITMEQCFHMCDRIVIYFFIASSYAPWLNLRELGPLASHMRWFIWIMAAAGTIYVFLYHEQYKIIELLFYLTMGFSPAVVVASM
eukprot:g39290.t1